VLNHSSNRRHSIHPLLEFNANLSDGFLCLLDLLLDVGADGFAPFAGDALLILASFLQSLAMIVKLSVALAKALDKRLRTFLMLGI